jgi:hypothetical protein
LLEATMRSALIFHLEDDSVPEPEGYELWLA